MGVTVGVVGTGNMGSALVRGLLRSPASQVDLLVYDVVEERAARLAEGPGVTAIASLEDLAERGWIEELTTESDRPEESERRRYYRINRDGSGVLAAEANRMQTLASAALARVAAGPLAQ